MEINGRKISDGAPPYLIAEVSANHNGDFERALQIINAAKEVGADAVKIQTYRPDTITLDAATEEFIVKGGIWDGCRLYDLYEEAHTPWDWHQPLFEYASKLGLTIFSSPFDSSAVDLLMDLNTPAFKVASFEVVDLPLIKYIASTGKPMIISTGMADSEEIEEALQAARDGGCNEIALLHCVSGYPAPASDYNLATISDMKKRWNVPVGLSDHTLDNTTAIASVAFGASVIEKHFTLDRGAGGPDDSFSLEPQEFESLCKAAQIAWEAIGRVDYGRKSSEASSVTFRRSLYFVKPVAKGEVITREAVRSVRPGFGLAPKYLEDIIGKIAKEDILVNTPCKWECVV